MIRNKKLTAKLSLWIGLTVLTIIALLGYLDILSERKYLKEITFDGARLSADIIKFNLDSQMMKRDLHSISDTIDILIQKQKTIKKIRLINANGMIVASSQKNEVGSVLKKESIYCRRCHAGSKPNSEAPKESLRIETKMKDDHRLVTFINPIRNTKTCSSAPCHVHSQDQKVLGVIATDYSLEFMETLLAKVSGEIVFKAFAVSLIIIMILNIFIYTLISSPIKKLLEGMAEVAGGNLDYRYPFNADDEIGHIGRIFNNMIDELVQKTGDLKTARDHLSGVIESSGDIILTVASGGVIESINGAGEAILGFSRDEVTGGNVEMLFATQGDAAILKPHFEKPSGIINVETRLRKKDGGEIDAILTLSGLKGQDEEAIAAICVFKDITEYKKLQRKAIHTERLVAVGVALAGISHNAKNILNNLKGGSYIMKLGFSKQKMELLKEGWTIMEHGISRLSTIAMEMLNFSSNKNPDLRPADINCVVGEVCDAGVLSAGGNIDLSWDMSPDIPVVNIDSAAIHGSILNLVYNSVDSCSEKKYPAGTVPLIKIRTFHDIMAETAVIIVSDNGTGIPDEIMDKIFNPFFTTKTEKGTGLGLALTKKIINEHKGSIEVNSTMGEGAVFTIRLPVG